MSRNSDIDYDCFDFIQKELLLKRDQLSSLIKQSTLLGNYYKEIVRETLAKFIPDKYSLVTGIITHNDKRNQQTLLSVSY